MCDDASWLKERELRLLLQKALLEAKAARLEAMAKDIESRLIRIQRIGGNLAKDLAFNESIDPFTEDALDGPVSQERSLLDPDSSVIENSIGITRRDDPRPSELKTKGKAQRGPALPTEKSTTRHRKHKRTQTRTRKLQTQASGAQSGHRNTLDFEQDREPARPTSSTLKTGTESAKDKRTRRRQRHKPTAKASRKKREASKKDSTRQSSLALGKDAGGNRRDWVRLVRSPSWVISIAVQVIIIALLAMTRFSIGSLEGKLFIRSGEVAEEEVELDEVEIDFEELETEDVEFSPLPMASMEVPDLRSLGNPVVVPKLQADVEGVGQALTDSLGEVLGNVGSSSGGGASGLPGAEFLGLKANGNRFVFVVDNSRSMSEQEFSFVVHELAVSIRKLKPQQKFYVLFNKVLRMQWPGLEQSTPKPISASPANIQMFEKWLRQIKMEGRTSPYEALELAVSMLPDNIIFLSDGGLSESRVADIIKVNLVEDVVFGREAKVPINTIAFRPAKRGGSDAEYSRDVIDNGKRMQNIAKQTGGTFRAFEPPNIRRR